MADDGNKTEQPEGVTPDAPEGGVTPPAASDEGVTPPTNQNPDDEAPVTRADLEKVTSALAKERDANKDLRSKIKGLVDPDEAQQQVKSVEDQLTTITQERDSLASQVARLTVALETGLPMELAKRLTGDTEDELRADAEALAQWKRPSVGTPHARTGAGENGSAPVPFDARRVAEEAASRARF